MLNGTRVCYITLYTGKNGTISVFSVCSVKAQTRGKGAPWWASGLLSATNRRGMKSARRQILSTKLLFFCVSTGLLVYVAMMVGALVWGGLCDKMGRRKCLIYVLSIDLIFSFLSCFAQGYGFFLFFRFCSGFG